MFPSDRGRTVGLLNGVVLIVLFFGVSALCARPFDSGPDYLWLNLGGHHRVRR